MNSAYHKNILKGDNHSIYNWEFADETARNASTDPNTGAGYLSAEIGKCARQLDDNSFYILTGTTPTWRRLGQRPMGFSITGPLTTASTYADIGLTESIKVGSVVCYVGAAVATSALRVDVLYHATNPASKTTIFTAGPGTNRPNIAVAGTKSTLGVPEVSSLAKDGHIGITLAGTFTAATNLTVYLIPA